MLMQLHLLLLLDCSVVAVANDTLLILKLETKGWLSVIIVAPAVDPLIKISIL
jgi:hypothetical protein